MLILDTDVLSGLMRCDARAIAWLDQQPPTSVWTTSVNIFEIRFGLGIMPPGRLRSQRAIEFERVVEEDLERRVVVFDAEAAHHSASLMAKRQLEGRPRDLRDSMIAGIAQSQGATLATRNIRHFDDLTVPVFNPWQA